MKKLIKNDAYARIAEYQKKFREIVYPKITDEKVKEAIDNAVNAVVSEVMGARFPAAYLYRLNISEGNDYVIERIMVFLQKKAQEELWDDEFIEKIMEALGF